MFRRSDLAIRMSTTPQMFPNNSHLIGDLAYPLKQYLLVGFKDNGRLSRREQKFNKAHSAARSTIERAFALLKGRWRRLKYLDMSNISQIPRVIMACCVLHNICLMSNDHIDVPAEDEEDIDVQHVNAAPCDEDRREGVRKRTDIMNVL